MAFLRGINSGRNPTVKMDALREVFEDAGYENVQTVIASGNVIFDTRRTSIQTLENKLEKILGKAFDFAIPAVALTRDSLQELFNKKPFEKTRLTSQARPTVTFLKRALSNRAASRYPVTGKGYTILGSSGRAIFSVVDRSIGKTPDLMKALEDEHGKDITTRTWKTVEKVLEKSET